MRTTALPHTCPHCGANFNYATDTAVEEARAPRDGDTTICVDCEQWSIFDSSTPECIRKPTTAEAEELAQDEECCKIQLALHLAKEKNK